MVTLIACHFPRLSFQGFKVKIFIFVIHFSLHYWTERPRRISLMLNIKRINDAAIRKKGFLTISVRLSEASGHNQEGRKVRTSVTRLGNLLDFGQLFKALGNNKFAYISHILRQFLKRCQNLSFF